MTASPCAYRRTDADSAIRDRKDGYSEPLTGHCGAYLMNEQGKHQEECHCSLHQTLLTATQRSCVRYSSHRSCAPTHCCPRALGAVVTTTHADRALGPPVSAWAGSVYTDPLGCVGGRDRNAQARARRYIPHPLSPPRPNTHADSDIYWDVFRILFPSNLGTYFHPRARVYEHDTDASVRPLATPPRI